MSIDRYCSRCGDHVNAREEPHPIPDSVRTMARLFCPRCGKELGSVYDRELRIDPVYPVAH